MRKFKAAAVAAVLAMISTASAQPFLPPGVMNPGGLSDNAIDNYAVHVVDRANVIHAVWASDFDYTGDSGTDLDLFYSSNDGGGWTPPVLVNSSGRLDPASGSDFAPRLVLGPDGVTLHCVWESDAPFGGSGTDYDIFYAMGDIGGWAPVEIVNHFAGTDGDSDRWPNLVCMPDGRVVVTWQSDHALPPTNIGSDNDILFSIRAGGTWTAAQPVNSNAATDTGIDEGPAGMTVTDDGDVIATWSTNDDFRVSNPVGNDYDIVFSMLSSGGSWSPLLEVTGLAQTDSGRDVSPAVVSIGSGSSHEIHFVWASNENLSGAGTDYDIFHAVQTPTSAIPPVNTAWIVNDFAATDGPQADDGSPALCVESGGVIHCAWESKADVLGKGTDYDILHSTNATAGGTWSPADLLGLNGLAVSTTGDADRFPNIVCAPNGVLSAMWSSTHDWFGAGTDWDIFHALGASRGISRPELVNTTGETDNNAVPQGDDRGVAIAVGPDGAIHAVWASRLPTVGGASTGNDYDILYSRLWPAGWTNPDLVNTNGQSDGGDDHEPSIGVDPMGTIHVAWVSYANINGTAGTDGDIFYSSNSGSGWSAPEAVHANATIDQLHDWTPKLAVGVDGVVHVVWQDWRSATGAPPATESRIVYAARTGSGWGAAETISPPYSGPQTATDEAVAIFLELNEIPHVVWESDADYNSAGTDDDIFYSNRHGGSWSTPEFVNDAANDSSDDDAPSIGITPNGIVHVVWDSDLDVGGAGTDEDILYSRREGAGWTTARLLSAKGATDTGYDELVRMAVDPAGGLHFTWYSNDATFVNPAGTDQDVVYAYIPRPGNNPSTAPIVLANTSGYAGIATDRDSNILVDFEGFVHIVWDSTDTLGDRIGTDWDCLHTRTNLPIQFFATPVRAWRLYR